MKKDLNFVPKYSLDYGIREIIKLMKKNLFLDLAKSKDRFEIIL